MAKNKTITLSGPYPDKSHESKDVWAVERITNSMQWNVGMFLEKREVQELCSSKNWNVIFKPGDRSVD